MFFTASDLTSITSHIQNWALFSLWLFILSGVISPLFSSTITGHLPTWVVHLSVSCLFAFSCCSWSSHGKILKCFCHSFLQWTTFCQNFPLWPIHIGWPYYLLIVFKEGRDFAAGLDELWIIMVIETERGKLIDSFTVEGFERQIRKNVEPVFYNFIGSFHETYSISNVIATVC